MTNNEINYYTAIAMNLTQEQIDCWNPVECQLDADYVIQTFDPFFIPLTDGSEACCVHIGPYDNGGRPKGEFMVTTRNDPHTDGKLWTRMCLEVIALSAM